MMRIGFDAKRAFYNNTGLGNYSRSIIDFMARFYPENQYYLFTPGTKKTIWDAAQSNMKVVAPDSVFDKTFRSYWRTFRLAGKIKRLDLDIYHGLSHELPVGVNRLKTASLVTIHDLIFIRYPEFYKYIDRQIYLRKVKYCCKAAAKIIATSVQTKNDIIEYLSIPGEKIEVVYQGCNPMFYKKAENDARTKVALKYGLPERYLLNVGTIEERKNLLLIVQALAAGRIDVPLVVIGRKTAYFDKVKAYITKFKLEDKVLCLQHISMDELPVIYQMAEIFIYPSLFEGFGIPILEALHSGIPVITSTGGCFKETGGESSVYINPQNADELAEAIRKILENRDLQDKMVEEGRIHAENFREEKYISKLFGIYQSLR